MNSPQPHSIRIKRLGSEEEKPDGNLSPFLFPHPKSSSDIQNYQFQLCELENEKEELEEKNKEYEYQIKEKISILKDKDHLIKMYKLRHACIFFFTFIYSNCLIIIASKNPFTI